MAGLYLHIPFCRKACTYCDFHFSTSRGMEADMVSAICTELQNRRLEVGDEKIISIYFGGGTPSILQPANSAQLMETIHTFYQVSNNAEITWEANPEDMSIDALNHWKSIGINRLSVGVQSFNDVDLTWMNRAHSAIQAIENVNLAQQVGFNNINVDLIYGIPNMTTSQWESNVEQVVDLNVQHLSAYHLTIEKKTALHHLVKTGRQKEAPEEQGVLEVDYLERRLIKAGWERYEISNFCRENTYAIHNTNYWKGEMYLGFGPSAHSFATGKRQWNIANNAQYIKGIMGGTPNISLEMLSKENQINEAIMLGLRTIWGLDLQKLDTLYQGIFLDTIQHKLELFTDKGWTIKQGNIVKLTHKGRLFADHIASELFVESSE